MTKRIKYKGVHVEVPESFSMRRIKRIIGHNMTDGFTKGKNSFTAQEVINILSRELKLTV